MNKILETFGKNRVLLPVIHCVNRKQTDHNIAVAIDHGADGVFLINQGGMSDEDVLQTAVACARVGLRVGVNLLRVGTESMVEALSPKTTHITHVTRRVISLWADDAGNTDKEERDFLEARACHDWSGLYFGGVAFKYRDPVPDHLVGVAALRASRWVDVVTTSGPATGEPPSVEKVRLMRESIGEHALAIASGISPENVEGFLPYVNAFLVATGIESDFGTLDAARVQDLADAIHHSVSPQ